MNEISWLFIGHMVCVSQLAAFLLVDRAYLGEGRVKHVGFWSVVLVAGMLAFSLIFQIGFFTLETVWYNVGYVLLSTLPFGGTLPQKLTAALINGTMCLLSENMVRYVVSWVTGTSLQVVWQRPGCLVTMTLTNLIVGVVVAYFSHQWKDERALESPQALVMSFFPGIVVVLNVVLMLSAKDEPADSLMVLLTLGLTVAVLLHMYIVQMFNQQMARQQELHVQTALERERAEALMDSYTTQRRLTHEFTNHIEALTLLLQQGEYEEAKAYLATVTKIIAAHTTIMNTHNPLLDALLSKKYEEATCKGVMLYFDLPDLRAIPLEKTDLVMVVSNLLNNAIDAAAQADPPEVYFRMRKTEEELLLATILTAVGESVVLPGTDANIQNGHVKQAAAYLQRRYTEEIDMERLAEAVHLHPNYLHRIFRAEMHCTVGEYLLRYRMEQARKLLVSSDVTVAAAGRSCGVPNEQQFSKLFKKVYGQSPRA